MSTQEGKLKAIADAIRQKEGTTEPIPADSFASRILALEAGGAPEGVCTINLTASDPDGGTVEGGGVASRDMTITVDAKVNAQGNFYFDGWEENGEVVSEDPQYTFPVTADRNLTALFLEAQYVAGVDWWEGVLPKSATWISVTYGDGKFVAVSTSKDNIAAYSEDGISWTQATLPASINFRSVTYGDGKFVAVGVGTYAAFSIDGKTWRRTALPKSATWFNVTYGDGKFVAVIEDHGNIAAYSEDGISWTQISLPGASSWRGVTYGDGKFVAVSNNFAASSTDGKTWAQAMIPGATWYDVTYGDGKFVVVGFNYFAYSTDGKTWTHEKFPETFYARNVTYGDGKFVAVGNYCIGYSKDGITWTLIEFPSKIVSSVTYGEGKFVAVNKSSNNSPHSSGKGAGG